MDQPVELPHYVPNPETTPPRLNTVFKAEGNREQLPQIDSINNIFQGIKAIQAVAFFYSHDPITSQKMEDSYKDLQQSSAEEQPERPLGNIFVDSDRVIAIHRGLRELARPANSVKLPNQETIKKAFSTVQQILSNPQVESFPFQEQIVEVTEENADDLLIMLDFISHELGHKIGNFSYTQLIKRNLSKGTDYTDRLQKVQEVPGHILDFGDSITEIMNPKNTGQNLDISFAEELIKTKFAQFELNDIGFEISEITPDLNSVQYKFPPVLLDLLFDNIVQNTIKAFGKNVEGTGTGMAKHADLIRLFGGHITPQNIYKEEVNAPEGEPPSQTPKLKIGFELSEDKRYLKFIFEDNGKGFPPEIIEKGFTRGSTNWTDKDPQALGARIIIELPVLPSTQPSPEETNRAA